MANKNLAILLAGRSVRIIISTRHLLISSGGHRRYVSDLVDATLLAVALLVGGTVLTVMALDAGATQASVLFAVVIAGLSWQLWSLQHAVVRPVDSFVSKLKATAATVVAGSEGAGGGSSTASLCDFATARMSHVMAKAGRRRLPEWGRRRLAASAGN